MKTRKNTLQNIIGNLHSLKATGLKFIDKNGVQEYSYEEIHYKIQLQCVNFEHQGVRPRDQVLISLECNIEYIITFLSIIYMGAVPVCVKNLSHNIGKEQYQKYLEGISSRQSLSFQYGELPKINKCNRLIDYHQKNNSESIFKLKYTSSCEDTSFIQYTSGSTGNPKPIALSNRAVCHNIAAITAIDNRTQESITSSFLPLAHDMGLISLLSNLYAKSTFVMADIQYFLRQPIKCLAIANKLNVSMTPLPNFLLEYICRVF